MRTDTAPKAAVYLKDYTAPDYKVASIDLAFHIFDDHTEVVSTTRYIKNHDGDNDLILNGERLILKSVSLNGHILTADEYKLDETTLRIACPNDEFTLQVTTQIDPAGNTSLEGLYKSEGTYCTQCESEGFRKITYFIDRPDIMTVFTTRIEADKKTCPVLLSNGNLLEKGDLDDGRHFTVWHDPFPKPCYLFALVAGDLIHIHDTFMTMTGRKVDLRIFVKDGDQDQCQFALESLIRSMKWDEEVFGREYQLDQFNVVAVSDFNFGAMENTSLNIFNTALVLARAETATDNDFLRVEGVIAHEYFHNWSGNRVTCRDWFQLSLKEGFTVFRDQEFTADTHLRAVKRIDDVMLLRSRQFPEDSGPLAHPIRPDNYIEINNFYTTTVYEKGGEVIRMQKALLGADKFRQATDLYFDRFDGQAVTCDDFVQCMVDTSGKDLSQFQLWYSQAGTPEIKANGEYNESKQTYTLNFSQTVPATSGQPHKKPMHMPIAVGLISPNGDEIQSTTILELKDGKQSFTFENIASKPVPSILRNFSAPVKLTTDLTDDDYRFLMIHDTDGFNRWESSQIIALRLINKMIDAYEEGREINTDPAFLTTIVSLLDQAADENQDKALLARMLSLPDWMIVAQERKIVDPDAIHAVMMQIMQDVLDLCRSRLEAIYESCDAKMPYKADPLSMGRRTLKRTVLRYLNADRDIKAVEISKNLYDSANNMTDRMMAVSSLIDTMSDEREFVLTDFYNRFKDYPLVIDKWFSVQALAVRPTTLEDLAKLAGHADFNLRNPNRVRSLYGVLSMSNLVKFHDRSGAGYTLLQNAVLQLDPINPHVSSRLLTALRDWKNYTPDRQRMMQAILEEIVSTKTLSPHAFEIASKTLRG